MHDLKNVSDSVASSLSGITANANNLDSSGLDDFAKKLQDLQQLLTLIH